MVFEFSQELKEKHKEQIQKQARMLEGKIRAASGGEAGAKRDLQHQVQEILLRGDYWDGNPWDSSDEDWTETFEDENKKFLSTQPKQTHRKGI